MTDLGDELARYWEAKRAAARSLRTMSGLLQEGSPMDAVLGNLARCLAVQLETPLPFSSVLPPWSPLQKPIPTIREGAHLPAQVPAGCYDASFGRVHVRPGCRC